MPEVKVIKRPSRQFTQPSEYDFDAEMALLEAQTAEKRFKIYLHRIEDFKHAEAMANHFLRLYKAFKLKIIDLKRKV